MLLSSNTLKAPRQKQPRREAGERKAMELFLARGCRATKGVQESWVNRTAHRETDLPIGSSRTFRMLPSCLYDLRRFCCFSQPLARPS